MADTKTNTEEALTIVGPGADDDDALPGEQQPVNEGAGEDYRYADEEGGEEDPNREERTGHAEEDPDAPADGQPLSREQKKRRKKRERYERDQRELALLRTRNEQLERAHSQRLAAMESRQTQSDVLAIDGRISQAQANVREAETLFAQAVKSGDEGAIAEALRVRDELRDGLRQYEGAKQQTVQHAQARQREAAQPPAQDPMIARRAQDWQREHAWFDPAGRDEDSAIVKAVEGRLFGEGRLHPSTDAYWEEVDRRLAKRLPERYANGHGQDDEDDEPASRTRRVNGHGKSNGAPRRATGPTIKVGGRERTLVKGEVYIDEDRKEAMVEAGVWDDPVQRAKYLKSYQRYDREAGRRPK
jgi:hypothetical protein